MGNRESEGFNSLCRDLQEELRAITQDRPYSLFAVKNPLPYPVLLRVNCFSSVTLPA